MFSGLRQWVFRRRQAYRAVFRPGGQLSPASAIVLADLAKFCRATRSTTVVSLVTQQVDPIASAQAEGRREVFLRITQHLSISDEDLYRHLKDEPQQEQLD
jgi:hypothetical protein